MTKGEKKEERPRVEEKYKALVETAADAIFTLDLLGRFTFANLAAERVSGYSEEELLGKHFRELLPAKYIPACLNVFQKALRGQLTPPIEIEMITKQGERVPLELLGRPIKRGRRIVEIISIARDITERKRAEEAVRESEERLGAFMDSAPDAFALFDSELNLVEMNKAASGMLPAGIKKEAVIGKNILDIAPGLKETGRYDRYLRVIKTGEPLFIEDVVPVSEFVGDRHLAVKVFKVGDGLGMITTDITERKQAEEALQESKELFEKTFISQRDAIFLLDAKSPPTIMDCNPRAIEVFGYTREEMLGRTTAFLHFDETTLKEFQEQLYPAIEERGFLHLHEFKMRRKDGKVFPSEHSVVPLEDEQGKRIGWVSVVRDITERKRTEEARRESEERYRSIVENSHAGILIVDQAYRFTYVNDELCRILGYPREEIIGQDFRTFLDDESKQLVADRYVRRQRGEKVPPRYEFNVVRKDGEKRRVEISSTVIKDTAGKAKTVAQILDITERKQAEEALRESEAWLQSIFRAAPTGIGVVSNRVIKYVNEQFCEIVGYSREELVGENARMVYPSDEEYERVGREKYEQIRERGRGTIETILKRKDGRIIDVLLSSTAIDPADLSAGVTFAALDITERKRAEEALRESEEKFRSLAERSPNMIFINKKGRVVYANEKSEEAMGYTREEFYSPGFDFLNLTAPESRQIVKSAFAKHKRGEEVEPYEYTLITKDGRRIEAIIATRLIDYEGERAILGIVTDITERKRMEEALRENEENFTAVAENANDGILVAVGEGVHVYVNKRAAEITGYSMAELLETDMKGLVHPDEFEKVMERYRKRLAGKPVPTHYETIFIRKDGKSVPVEFTAAKTIWQGEPASVVFFRDVTERKQAEEALRAEKALMDALMDNIPDSIYFKDRQCRLTRINRTMMRSLGLKKMSQALGKTDVDLYGEEFGRKTLAQDQHILTTGEPIIGMIESRRLENGQINWTSTSKVPLRDANGQIVGLVGATREINELMRAEEEIRRRTEELAALNAIAMTVTSTLDLQEVLQTIQERVMKLLGEKYPPLFTFFNEGDHTFRIVLTNVQPQLLRRVERLIGMRFEELSFPLSALKPARREALFAGKPYVTDNGSDLTPPGTGRRLIKGAQRIMAVKRIVDLPLWAKGKLVGTMVLLSQKERVSDGEMELLSAISNQAAIAIENARLYEEAQRRIGELSGLHEISQAFSSMTEVRETFGELTKRMAQLVGCQICVIGTYDHQAREMRAQPPGYGAPDELVRSFRYKVDVPGVRDAWNFRLQGPLLANDIAQTPDFFSQWVEGFGFFNLLIAPMAIEGRITGLVYAANKPDGFAEDDSKLLTIFASRAAIAIENARLYEKEREQRREAETLRQATQALSTTLDLQEVFESILSELQQVVPYDSASVQLLRGDGLEIIGGYGFPNLDELLGISIPLNGDNPNRQVVATRAPFIVEDAPAVYCGFREEPHAQAGIRAWLGVPLLFGDRLIGMIALDKRVPGFYTEEHARLALAFAAQAAIAIENARLYEETKRRMSELAALQGVSLQVTSSLDLAKVLGSIAESALKLVEATDAHIFFYDEARGEFRFGTAVWEGGERGRVAATPREDGFTATVARQGELLVINDAETHPLFTSQEAREWKVKAIAGFPLKRAGKVLGVLNIAFLRPHTFDDGELRILALLADQAAIAIENAQLFEGERRRATHLTVINEVGRKAISILDLEEMLEEVAHSIRSSFDYYNVALFLVDKDRSEAVMEAVARGFECIVPGEYRQSLDQGIIGWVISTGRSWLANDVSQDPYYIKGFLEEILTKSELCVPIQLGGEVIGALDIQSIHLNAFDETDVTAMEVLSSQIAIAIENARLYETMKRRVTELSILQEAAMAAARLSDFREVVRAIVEEMHGTLGFPNVQAWLLDEKAQQLVIAASVGYLVPATIKPKLGQGITGWVALHRQPQNVPDVSKDPRYICKDERVRSELAVPLVMGDRLIGVLNIEHYELNAFSEHDVRLLSALAGQISVAIDSAQLREEERKRAHEFSVLLDTAQTLASSLDLAQLLETIASQAKELTQADGSRIYLLEPDEEILKALVVLEDYAEEIMATPVAVGQGITGHVAATGIAEIVNHAEHDPRAVQIPGTPEETECLMCVPLTVKGEVIGVMTLSREGEKEFEESDLRLLTSLASQAATAIENARLYEKTKWLAATDPLTGVWNRRHIQERLGIEVARARRFGHELSVLVMDIDDLKLFNDTYGHATGDGVIRTVAQAVLGSCREIDVVGRYGGDEFAVLLPETDAQGANVVADRILANLEKEPFQAPEGTKVPISLSMGAASYPSDSDEAGRLFSLADAAMYRAKVAGGGQFASPTVAPVEVPEELVAPFDALQGLLISVDAKDHYTFKHSQDVTGHALALARAVGISEEEMKALEIAGKLHDVGKIGIPTNILRKPGPLTEEEWQIVQQHPRLGYTILQQLPQMETVLQSVLHHHERWDGNGYPDGLKGKKIPKLARILAIADAYSAMLADRPYRKALSEQKALQEIHNCAGTQFDPELAESFVDLLAGGKWESKAGVPQSAGRRA